MERIIRLRCKVGAAKRARNRAAMNGRRLTGVFGAPASGYGACACLGGGNHDLSE